MNYLILGGNSQIGNELQKVLKRTGDFYRATYNTFKTDDSNFTYYNPLENAEINLDYFDVVVNCIAYTDVDGCQNNPDLSFKLNHWLPLELSAKCKFNGSKFIHFSTDYVFDGKNGPYTEDDKPNPSNVYGTHKLLSEIDVLKNNPNALVIRLSGLYSKTTGKSFIERVVEKLKTNNDVWGVTDQYYTPIFASDVANAIPLLLEQNGIWHLSSNELVNRFQIIQKLKNILDSKSNIIPVKTEELETIAKRPLFGGLISPKINNYLPLYDFLTIDEVITNEFKE